jgi:RimJ/RimL family protein N-acetyltransferase
MQTSNSGLRLSVRVPEPKDAALLANAYTNTEFIELYRSNNSLDTEEKILKAMEERSKIHPAQLGYIEFIIEHSTLGPVGVAALGDYSALHRRAEFLIGIFDEKHWGAGFGIEATLLLIDLAFNSYSINRVYSYAYGYNENSKKNMLKFGFISEGTLRSHHFSTAKKTFFDLCVFSIIENDFREHKKIAKLSNRLLGRDITKKPFEISLDNMETLDPEKSHMLLTALRAASLAGERA